MKGACDVEPSGNETLGEFRYIGFLKVGRVLVGTLGEFCYIGFQKVRRWWGL